MPHRGLLKSNKRDSNLALLFHACSQVNAPCHNMHACKEEKQSLEAGLQTKRAFRVTFLTRGNGLEKGKMSVCLFIGEQQMWGTELSTRTPKGFSLCQVKPVALCKPLA